MYVLGENHSFKRSGEAVRFILTDSQPIASHPRASSAGGILAQGVAVSSAGGIRRPWPIPAVCRAKARMSSNLPYKSLVCLLIYLTKAAYVSYAWWHLI